MMISLRETPEQKVYVTADPHLNHAGPVSNPVWKSRGYADVKSYTDDWFRITNELVRPNDILIVIGDYCLNTTIEQFEECLARTLCQNIYMLLGNHANPHYKKVYIPLVKSYLGESYIDGMELYPLRYKNVIYVGQYLEAILNGHMFIISHFPFLIWDHMQHGAICLTGHSHSSCKYTNSKGTYGRILDCGWDEFKKPLSIIEVMDIVNNKVYHPLDHHL